MFSTSSTSNVRRKENWTPRWRLGRPYISGGLAMGATGIGTGHNDSFVYQARALLDEVSGLEEIQSLSEYALSELRRSAESPTLEELFDRVRERAAR